LPKVLHGIYSVLLSWVRTRDLVFELIWWQSMSLVCRYLCWFWKRI
jgi:hypothetical protein